MKIEIGNSIVVNRQLCTSVAWLDANQACLFGIKRANLVRGQRSKDEVIALTALLESCSFSDFCWLASKSEYSALIPILVKAAKKCADSVQHLKNKRAAVYADAAATAYTAASTTAYAVYADAADAAAADAAAAAAAYDYADAVADAYAAADTAAYAADDAAAQHCKNKQFLIEEIKAYEATLS